VANQVELSPFEFLDQLADLVPPPRKHRHHGVVAPNPKLRRAATALVIGNGAPLTSKKRPMCISIPAASSAQAIKPAHALHAAR
jgi:hypothetical protein